MLDRLTVINRRLALLQRHVGFLPGWLAAFKPSAPGHLAHEINRAHAVNLYLKDRLHRRPDLPLGGAAINSEGQQLTGVLRFFLRDQRFLGDYRRLDDVPNCSHYSVASPPSEFASASASGVASAFGFRARFGI